MMTGLASWQLGVRDTWIAVARETLHARCGVLRHCKLKFGDYRMINAAREGLRLGWRWQSLSTPHRACNVSRATAIHRG